MAIFLVNYNTISVENVIIKSHFWINDKIKH